MKRKSISFTKRCISALLAVPIASLGLVTTFAENGMPEQSDAKTRNTYIIGDANGDGIVDVNDATAIQKAIAECPLDYFDEIAADVDGSGLTVNNVTNIQKYLGDITTRTKSAQKPLPQNHEPDFPMWSPERGMRTPSIGARTTESRRESAADCSAWDRS